MTQERVQGLVKTAWLFILAPVGPAGPMGEHRDLCWIPARDPPPLLALLNRRLKSMSKPRNIFGFNGTARCVQSVRAPRVG